ncbi:hypothetical protein FB451DRAFT_734562 [Mycena latifolia]|nr:hypothetical protein FB451DRAFT_734562 [Mycena latifolia]
MFISRAFIILTVAAIGLATPAKRTTVVDIKQCLSTFGSQVTALDKTCQALSSATPGTEVQAIGPKAAAVAATIVQCIATVANTDHIDPSDCDAIFNQIHGFAVPINDALKQISIKFSIFAAINGATVLVGGFLHAFDSGCAKYIDTLALKCPVRLSRRLFVSHRVDVDLAFRAWRVSSELTKLT